MGGLNPDTGCQIVDEASLGDLELHFYGHIRAKLQSSYLTVRASGTHNIIQVAQGKRGSTALLHLQVKQVVAILLPLTEGTAHITNRIHLEDIILNLNPHMLRNQTSIPQRHT